MNQKVKEVLASVKKGPKKGQKGRKVGRNTKRYAKYKLLGIRIKNKIRKMLKHIKAHPDAKDTIKRLGELKNEAYI